MPALETFTATRIVATPAALDNAAWPENALPLRTAPDEVLLTQDWVIVMHSSIRNLSAYIASSIRSNMPNLPYVPINSSIFSPFPDPHAIIEPEGSFMGLWLPKTEALNFLEHTCAWELPIARPAFAQGAIANVPVKLWLESERVLFIVQAPFAADFLERLE